MPGTFAEVYYDYAFVEEVIGINTNRSDFGFQAGYFHHARRSACASSPRATTRTAGFPTTRRSSSAAPSSVLHHDQIAKSSNVSVGGGLSYVLTGSTEVSVSYLRSVYGRTGHKIDHGIGFGFSWSFSPEQIIRGLFPPKPGTLGPFDR